MTKQYKIRSLSEIDDESGDYLYWNNIDGWVDKESASIYDEDLKETIHYIPLDSKWEMV